MTPVQWLERDYDTWKMTRRFPGGEDYGLCFYGVCGIRPGTAVYTYMFTIKHDSWPDEIDYWCRRCNDGGHVCDDCWTPITHMANRFCVSHAEENL